MMQLGSDGVFVGSGIFKSEDPEAFARAVVRAVTFFNDPSVILDVSRGLGEPMRGIDLSTLRPEEVLATRGW
jgi:pyridoxal 5'-phosphate synthase pdxS subunit